jgi:prepilin-type N-terminal cleavage/methylation domain-containing protein/prepilin-type processing-associated H-X9-DG protein
MRHLSCRCAFSLVELLVVLAVIGLLIGLLVPTFQAIRSSALATTCQGQQRQIVMAAHVYASERRGGLPATRLATGQYWFDLIQDYLGLQRQGAASQAYAGTMIRGCPAYTFVYDPANIGNYSYGINAYLAYGDSVVANGWHNRIGGTSDAGKFREFRRSAVSRPATRLYLSDRNAFWTGSTLASFAPRPEEARHRGRLVAVFVDGHGSSRTPAEVMVAQTDPP